MNFGINYIDYYLPKEELSIDAFLSQVDASVLPKAFANKEEYKLFANSVLELESIKVENTRDSNSLLSDLLDKMFDAEIIDPLDIDLIVLINEVPNDLEVNIGQQLQFTFGMSNAYVINLSGNHCANFEVAISTVSKIDSSQINNVLILNSTIASTAEQRIIGTYGILGDASGVMLLSKKGTSLLNIHECHVINNGRLHKANVEVDNSMLHTKYLLKCIKAVSEKSGMQLANIDKIVVQNANPMLNTHVLSNVGIDINKMYNKNFGKHGHLDCLDFLVNLKDICDGNELNKEDLILSLGMGWAGSYVSILFSKN